MEDKICENKAEKITDKAGSNYKKRLFVSVIPVFLTVFIYFIFGPLDILVINGSYVSFSYTDIVLPVIVIALILTVVITAILALFRGKLFDILLCLVSGFGIMSYVNGTFLNKYLGSLNGIEPNWTEYSDHAIVNLIICIVIFVIPLAIYFISKKPCRKLFVAVCGILIGMQLVGLVSTIITTEPEEKRGTYLNTENQFKLSADGNIVIFLLDAFSNRAMENMIDKYPDALDPFSDFTYYNNNNTLYVGTFPSTTYLLTGHEYDFSKKYSEFFDDAWNSESAELFYKTLAERGYEFNLYDMNEYIAQPPSLMEGKIANLKKEEPVISINYERILLFQRLAAYRYVPFMFKSYFFITTYDLNSIVTYSYGDVESSASIYPDHSFLAKLRETGISIDSGDSKRVSFNYLWGAHPPFSITADGLYSGSLNGSTQEAQCKGYLFMVSEYIDRMKALGIYDDSTIIIMADHGDLEEGDIDADVQSIFLIKKANEKHDEIVISNAPTSHENFLATLIEATGGEYSQFGESMSDVPENTLRERRTFRWMMNEDYPNVGSKFYNVMQEYHYTGGRAELREKFIEGAYEIYPLLDSFYS